jgi:tryptophan-rich hypothetical protein
LKTKPAPTAMPDEATAAVVPARRNPLSPKKLLLSKWTAVQPLNREKHFVVVRVIEPEPPAVRIEQVEQVEQVELEAVHSRRVLQLHWRDLTDPRVWRQGWV